ncbi:MAG: HAMP domain-containing histidine kinase [Culturomica sp.]|jgi:two-component system phosphate regulon sensor histidine kinase PhoR|nr:HAMP domain-containing histidine kinase [Culturomica sp.]
MQEELNLRRSEQDTNVIIVTNSKIQATSGHQQGGNSLTWVFDIYVLDRYKYIIKDSSDLNNIVQIYENQKPTGITKYQFTVSDRNNERGAYDAMERFCIDEHIPFTVEHLESLLKDSGIPVKEVFVEKVDSMVWSVNRENNTSMWKPEMSITYPYDIFEGELVKISCSIGMSPVIMKMLDILLISIILSVLLIVCFVFQIATIQRQRKLEELRQDFIYTMIHELKRPISTLKMCVSFMRNNRLMQDKDSRDAIINNSYNELDNLSAYFSKLRDLTFNNVTEIPLNLSTFNVSELLKECIDKLNIPSDKKVSVNIMTDKDVMLTADKVHTSNIISNLLENSVKYSPKDVNIEISYNRQDDNSFCISIRDNGFGISKSESKYVFNKFFRSKTVINTNITGMGLGLAYVKLLIAAHKGTIHMESDEGVGTTFIINLPQ